ncbi:hypothetical protein EYF80_041770 [Liparis tanakae]|uniref:Uncharacterized protein n=1 Tax=Liparis tanakae TaxID=230148 RepID=A0A4Z2G607_9TELE|nr:hypothetical protein EYF80_041770 [Liparis tanakae]
MKCTRNVSGSIKASVRLMESSKTRREGGSNTGRTLNPSVSQLMMANKAGKLFVMHHGSQLEPELQTLGKRSGKQRQGGEILEL